MAARRLPSMIRTARRSCATIRLPVPPEKPINETFEGRNVTIDRAIVDLALAGNMTAKVQVAKAFGADTSNSPASLKASEEADLFLKAEHSKRTKLETGDEKGDPKGTNPWSATG